MQELEFLLAEPLAAVRQNEQTAFDRELSKSGGQVVLFGAGNLGRRVLAILQRAGITPVAFADNRKVLWGTQIEGIPVLSPSDAAARFGSSSLCVVTIWSPGHRYADTREKLKNLGCANVICATRLRWKFAADLLPDYCQDLPSNLYRHGDSILQAAALMADEFSLREFLRQVRWRALGDFGELSPPHPHQYFPDGLFALSSHEVFVDCGAYNGITVQRFIQRAPDFLKIHAIEADPRNYAELCRCLAEMPQRERIQAHRVAVGADHSTVRFESTGTVQSAVSTQGDIEVEQVPLDDLLQGEEPTYIKMDIEGAEFGALQGARNLIRKSQPLLAVCLYHTPIDFWRIPLLIHELAPDHSVFIRPHVEDGWDLVAYAVPPNRLVA